LISMYFSIGFPVSFPVVLVNSHWQSMVILNYWYTYIHSVHPVFRD
jgi:hypothetical protein